ncbi:hypothetical protein DNU06_06320 [Putridiphycobacter roseus]|uniref:Peptidyl-prolyl cis-trans isomerase n=1 Tax=Putridiphycobacter roseus TaxID=2219161 RepID=A0A2W1N1S1_9FLAO|nr:FKBP-type peptidyl-prolyl cis-trans isomerase [Putridiphycobacter roseus]PZE18227.1 hypothetical protein DNU06_06320 [Putridiphycobacter roseus]
MLLKGILFSSITILLVGCNQKQDNPKVIPNWSKEESIKMNHAFAAEELEEIEQFLSHRPDWKMTKTGSGLQYFIYLKTDSASTPVPGRQVAVNFTVSLLNGHICYSSKRGEPEFFTVEKSDIESGLHEGIKLMHKGEKAKFILPNHLAHGLIGDLNEIPPLQTIVYDIELIDIK